MKKLIATAMLGLVCILPTEAQILRTTVAQGEIEGELHNGFALYKAIPYAEAPVGKLRWKNPVPKTAWEGVYKAEKWGDRPFQTVDPNQNGGDLGMSENCLYLSVETPAKSKEEKLPVFVMIHGGAFATGSYSGTQDNFVKEGIVYCSIEYRLGALGFMSHPELTKESPEGISGNYGIYDQICALQWIHDNIAAFGGDPEKVTICGESAGGISVSILCASPMCKGLFRGAISESGGNFAPIVEGGFTAMKPISKNEEMGKGLQENLKAKNLKKMRQATGEEIIAASQGKQFWPCVDGKAIVGDQYKLYEEGSYNDVDVLIGYNSDEGSLFVYQMQLDAYKGMINGQYGEWAGKLMEAYPATNDKEALWAVQDIFRDNAFGWHTWAWANLQSRTGKGRVYMYYFDQLSENSILGLRTKGATHVAEMPFIYAWPGKMTETDKHMAQIMPQYWINFVKNGDPNADGLPYWTTYKQGEATIMHMHNGFQLIPAPNQKQMDFWEEYFKAQRK